MKVQLICRDNQGRIAVATADLGHWLALRPQDVCKSFFPSSLDKLVVTDEETGRQFVYVPVRKPEAD